MARQDRDGRGLLNASLLIMPLCVAGALACSVHRLPAPRPLPAPSCNHTDAETAEFRWGILSSILHPENGLDPLRDHLSSRLGVPVQIVVLDRYEDLGHQLLGGSLEAALLPPQEYVRTRDREPCLRPLLTAVVNGAVRYSSFLVARKDARIFSLGDLRGLRGAFVSPDSASGWIFAWWRMRESGIDPWRDLSEVRFLGSHPAVIEAVISGQSDIGATFDGALLAARRDGLDIDSLVPIAAGGRIPYDVIVVRPDVSREQTDAFVEALRNLDTTTDAGRRALAPLWGYNGFVPTDDRFYDEVRRVAREVLEQPRRSP